MKSSTLSYTSWTLLIGAFFVVAFLSQCRKDKVNEDGGFRLEFSADTVQFDTVFTQIGSTTNRLRVFNRGEETVRISEILLEGGSSSNFRINIDGINTTVSNDIEIDGNDSLYIFVEVTVDPNNNSNPFLIEDFISFTTNGNVQRVPLHAWGQNANYIGSLGVLTTLGSDGVCDEIIWDGPLPYVLFGVVAIDSCDVLTIRPGTQIHCHANSGILVFKSTIDVQGEQGNEVVFQGDRLENVFLDEPGQWGINIGGATRGGVWISGGKDCKFQNTIIKNGVIGLQVDTLNANQSAVEINNTIIVNCSAHGLLAQGSKINSVNSLYANCGQSCAFLSIGGEYDFNFCTFGNYWSSDNRQSPAFALQNWYEDIASNIIVRDFTNTRVRNSIMYGNNADLNDFDEFIVNIIEEEGFPQDFLFEDCFVDSEINFDLDSRYSGMRVANNSFQLNFVDTEIWDFRPISESSILNASMDGPSTDLFGFSRGPSFWEKGCLEAVQ